MKTFLKRLILVILLTIIGGVIGYLLADLSLKGHLESWELIEKPPSTPVKILAINKGLWISTVSGEIYHYDDTYYRQCKESCWFLSDNAPSDEPTNYLPKDCGHVPPLIKFNESKATCNSIGIASVLTIYAIDEHRSIYRWAHGNGDMDGLRYFGWAVYGLGFGFTTSVLVVIVLYTRDFISYQKKVEMQQ